MTEVAAIVAVLLGLGAAFWAGMRLQKYQMEVSEQERTISLLKALGELQKKFDEREKSFAEFKDKVAHASNAEQLTVLLREALS
jgi:hypothetical protein